MKKPIIVFPKGRLYEKLKYLFINNGINMPPENTRKYFFEFEEFNMFFAKPKSIPQLIFTNIVDFGFVGDDIIQNSIYNDSLIKIFSTDFNQVKMIIGKSNNKPITNKIKIVATEYDLIASEYFTKLNIPHYILNTAGSTEGYVSICSDYIVDVTETGKTIEENNIEIIDELFISQTSLYTYIQNKNQLPEILKHIQKTFQ